MSKWPKWFEWPEWPGWPKWPKWPGWLDDRNLRRQLTVFLWSIHGLSVVKKEPIWPIWLLTSDFLDPEAGTCLPTSGQSSTVAKRCIYSSICPFIRTLVISSLLFLFPSPAPGGAVQLQCQVMHTSRWRYADGSETMMGDMNQSRDQQRLTLLCYVQSRWWCNTLALVLVRAKIILAINIFFMIWDNVSCVIMSDH